MFCVTGFYFFSLIFLLPITYSDIILHNTFHETNILCREEGTMITSVDQTLAQQIVNTVKDVCGYDINFINRTGIIFASTNPSRIGTFHEIGKRAAALGTMLEVTQNDSFTGTRQGINLPVYHNGRMLAVIGITGDPQETRKYAYLAERMTLLLIREQELNAFSRTQADKKHFAVTSLMREDPSDREYLTECLNEFRIDPNSPKRFLILQVNSRYNLMNLSLLEQKIHQLFAQIGITLFTFSYPREFFAIAEERDFLKNEFLLQTFARKNPELIQIAAGRTCTLFQLPLSCESARTALKSLENSADNYVVFDHLTLELILSSAGKANKEEFLRKTIAMLTAEEQKLLQVYFSEDMSLSGTCETLYLHKNTLQYRLNRIHEKTGWNPRKFRDAVLLYLALKLRNE